MDATHGTPTLRSGRVAVWAWIVAVALTVGLAILITIAALGSDTAVEVAPGPPIGEPVDIHRDYIGHMGWAHGVGLPQPSEPQQPQPCHGQC